RGARRIDGESRRGAAGRSFGHRLRMRRARARPRPGSLVQHAGRSACSSGRPQRRARTGRMGGPPGRFGLDQRSHAGSCGRARRRGRRADARGGGGRAARPRRTRGRRMTVYLVGGGPGDPGLLTARALELIAEADVIVYDRLIRAQALEGARPEATLLYAGKEGGKPSMSQAEIDRLLVEHGKGGRTVVRLKGGDPFVFG